MLEDESLATTQVRQGSMFSKVLPNLSNNIICGNSLIGWDIMQGQLFEDDELKKLNPMDFETAFPKIIKAGGFDAIVGNPPYVDYRMFNPNEVKYYKSRYYSAQTKEKYSLYIPFVEKAISTLNKKGLFGYIIPNTFLATKMGLKLREYLIHQNSIIEINDVSKLKVFGNVGTYPVLLFCSSNIGTNKIRVIYSDNKTNFINPSHNYIDLKVII